MTQVRLVRRVAFVALCLALLAASACAAPAYRAASVEHGQLHRVAGSWILELNGTPEERGRAAGQLVGEQVRWLLPRYLRKTASIETLSPAQKKTLAALTHDAPASHLAEVAALAQAARVDGDALLAANLAPELNALLACSALGHGAPRSQDGKVRLARNLDWPGGDLLAGLELVVIESGANHRFASFTWPGLVGVVTGMNDAGLAVADLMAFPPGDRLAKPGVPVLFAIRHMLEETASTDEALAWLQKAPRTLPQNYALADPSDARTVETGPSHFRVRPSADGLARITNFWDEDRGGRTDGRYARLIETLPSAPLGPDDLKAALARAVLGELNVQAVVIEPDTRVVYVAHGKAPVASGTWSRLDLAPCLRR